MFIIGELLLIFSRLIGLLLSLYELVLIASVVISWVRPTLLHPTLISLVQIIQKITQPFFEFIRKKGFPLVYQGLDFTPLVAWVIVKFGNELIVSLLTRIGTELSFR